MQNNNKILDVNFNVPVDISKERFNFYNAIDLDVYGVNYINNKFCRLEPADAAKINEKIHKISFNTSGGRVRFSTNSPEIAIYVEFDGVTKLSNYPLSATMGFDIYSKERFIGVFVPPFDSTSSYESVLKTPFCDGNMHEYTLNLPISSSVKHLLIGITRDSCITCGNKYSTNTPIVFYGSSTTQGACASRPGNTYENIVCRAVDCNYINLGFGGNALGEEAIAKYIAGLEMSAFVYDYDYNAPDCEHLRSTHEKMFRIIRESNPEIPIIILTAPRAYLNDLGYKREKIVYNTYEQALQAGDKNVYYLSGAEIIKPFRDCALADNIHPGDIGFYAIANALIPILKRVLK